MISTAMRTATAAVLITCWSSVASAQAPGTATGERIGNAISAAVSTAFPAIQPIISAIWPTDRNQNKKAADAETVLKAKKAEADKLLAQNTAQLKQAAADLAVARNFVTSSSDILARLSVMQATLASRPDNAPAQLSDAEKKILQDWWTPAKARLDALQSVEIGKNIDSMSDVFLKTVFNEIRGSITDNAANIATQLSDGRATALDRSLARLTPQFARIGPLASILIGDIGVAVERTVTNLSGAGGVGHDSTSGDRKSNLALLEVLRKQK